MTNRNVAEETDKGAADGQTGSPVDGGGKLSNHQGTRASAASTMRRRLLAAATIALGSFLLFSVEPMAAKQLLPVLGGSSAVWLTCLFFFQTMLLAAYGYVFWALRSRATRGRGLGALHL